MTTKQITTEDTHLVFVSKREYKKTETSTPMVFVTVANTKTYERFELIADKTCNTNFESDTKVIMVTELSNYNNRASTRILELHAKK